MRITEDEQTSTDFDWFCVDVDGHIGHLASAGFKRLPPSVAQSAEDLQFLRHFFDGLDVSAEGHILDEQLSTDMRTERYLRSFVAMADRGLYSFDIEIYLRSDTSYFRVAIPKGPLRLHELPDRIGEILERTRFRGSLAQSSMIPYSETLLI